MSASTILLVTDRDGVRGFIDASAEGFAPDASQTAIQLSDGGLVRVASSLLTQLDDTNYFVSCSLRDLLPPDLLPPPEAAVRREVVATVPVIQESVSVHKEMRETGAVQVHKQVHERSEHVEVSLRSEDVEITRVPMDRVVDGPIPVRQEGDTTIYSVLEEVLVIEKRLVLREELHLRVRHSERVEARDIKLRSEEVTIQRSTVVRPPPPPPTNKRGDTP